MRACPLVLPPENCGVVPDGQDGLDYSTPGTPCYATCDFFTQCDAACAPGGAHYPQCLSQPENADCPLFAYTAEDLFNTVRGFSKNTKVPLPVIGAHGTSWATGGSTDWGVNYPEDAASYTHLRAHETDSFLVCRLLLVITIFLLKFSLSAFTSSSPYNTNAIH